MGSLKFKVDLQDMQFILFDQLDIDTKLKNIEKYAEFDQDTYMATLEEAARMAEEVLHPIDASGDKEGCTFHGDGKVTTPKGFKEAWDTMAEGGWFGVNADPEVGGIGLPNVVAVAATEMFASAATAFQMYPGLSAAAARVIQHFGPEGKKENVAEKMFTGEWGGTMCLTEAGAGSDVGENRTKATPNGDGSYQIEGEKIFISGGDQDLTENIVHLVLARTPDAQPGTKGLSLFLVPKFVFDDDLGLGERNDAMVVGIEEKMGIHGNATCSIAFGANGSCKGWMVGNEFEGIAIMFHMMNEARIGVGLQGVASAAASYHYAKTYAKERLQGADIKNFKDAAAPRVPIIEHADVRRMLMSQKVLTETMRSFCYRLAQRHDLALNAKDEAEAEKLMGAVDLLVPVLKGHCTDQGYNVTITGIQVFGGYGFTGEYPAEQVARDAKIQSIYEGTNGIQALDLLGRKLRIKGGALFMNWMQEAQQEVAAAAEAGFAEEAAAVGKSIQHLGATAMHLGQLSMTGKLEGALLNATPFLEMFGWVQLGLEALHQAVAAKKKIDAEGESNFLKGKLLNLKFYTANYVPKAIALGKTIQAGDDSCLDEALFA